MSSKLVSSLQIFVLKHCMHFYPLQYVLQTLHTQIMFLLHFDVIEFDIK